MMYLEEVDECFYLKDYGKLFCIGLAIDTEDVGEGGELPRYPALIKVDKFYETTFDELPKVVKLLVKALIGKEGG